MEKCGICESCLHFKELTISSPLHTDLMFGFSSTGASVDVTFLIHIMINSPFPHFSVHQPFHLNQVQTLHFPANVDSR